MLMGAIYRDQGDFEKARGFYTESLAWLEKTDNQRIRGSIYLSLGYISLQTGNYSEAMTAFQKALEVQEALGNKANQAKILDHIGTVYRRINNPGKAVEYFSKALDLREQVNDKTGISASLNNLAVIYVDGKQYEKALDYYFRALKISRETGNKQWQGNQFHNIGVAYKNLQRYQEAHENFGKALDIYMEIRDRKGEATVYQSLGDISWKQKKPARAIEYCNRSNAIAHEMGMNPVIAENERILASAYQEMGNYRSALDHYKIYTALKDSILNEKNLRNISEIQAKFETRAREAENGLLKKELEITGHHNNTKRIIIIFLLVLVGAIALISMLAFRNLNLRRKTLQKSNELLEQEKAMHEMALKKKEVEQELLEERIFAEQELTRLQTEKLDYKSRELSSLTLRMLQKNEILEQMPEALRRSGDQGNPELQHIYSEMVRIVQSNLDLDHDWEQFKLHFQEVHEGFFSKLGDRYPGLTQHDLRLCAYLRMNLSSKEVAQLMNITLAGINKSRQRLRHKLGVDSDTDLVEFLRRI
jgi:tetratricopeptide (TPR) repeat protein